MKAIVCKEFGHQSKLVLEDMEPHSPKKNEKLIDIHFTEVIFMVLMSNGEMSVI